MVRDDLPWLYELLVEVYRDVRGGDSKTTQRAIDRLPHVTKMLTRGPFMEELASKDAHMILMALPRMFDQLLHRIESRPVRVRMVGTEADAAKPDEER